MVWRVLGAPEEDLKPKNIVRIPRWFALYLAFGTEAWCALVGSPTEFTVYAVRYSPTTQWCNIDKVRFVLDAACQLGS